MQSGLFGIGLWLPQIVQSVGYSTMATGFVIAPPYLASAAAMVFWGRSSDRTGERIWHLAMAAFLGTAGLVAAGVLRDDRLVLMALFIGMIGVHCTFGPFWGIATSILRDKGAAGGIAFINSVGSLGGFLAPTYIGLIKQHTGGYGLSMVLLGGELLVAGLIVIILRNTIPAARGMPA